MTDVKPATPETLPGIATAYRGAVILDGPDGVAVAMTPGAAAETGQRLIDAACKAEKQHIDCDD